MSQYATAKESAGLVLPITHDQKWLEEQLDRIAPHRHEMGAKGDIPALVTLALQQKATRMKLQGEACVMRVLLEESLKIISTIEPEDDIEHMRLESLKRTIVAVVESQLVQS